MKFRRERSNPHAAYNRWDRKATSQKKNRNDKQSQYPLTALVTLFGKGVRFRQAISGRKSRHVSEERVHQPIMTIEASPASFQHAYLAISMNVHFHDPNHCNGIISSRQYSSQDSVKVCKGNRRVVDKNSLVSDEDIGYLALNATGMMI